MEIGIHANMVDYKTSKIADALGRVFEVLCDRLKSDYGGIIEHLWIDFELIESYAKPDGKPRFPFRFANRVSGRSSFGLPPSPDYYNVGHFSVRPNFPYLLSIPEDEVISYCLNLIYKELMVLKAKEKKLGGFNSELFRNRFYEECKILGYTLNSY
jgi:hypothetical protein